MLIWEDEELMRMLAQAVEDPSCPLEPIADRIIEMGHHTNYIDFPQSCDKVRCILNRSRVYNSMFRIASNVSDIVYEIEPYLADWVPF